MLLKGWLIKKRNQSTANLKLHWHNSAHTLKLNSYTFQHWLRAPLKNKNHSVFQPVKVRTKDSNFPRHKPSGKYSVCLKKKKERKKTVKLRGGYSIKQEACQGWPFKRFIKRHKLNLWACVVCVVSLTLMPKAEYILVHLREGLYVCAHTCKRVEGLYHFISQLWYQL